MLNARPAVVQTKKLRPLSALSKALGPSIIRGRSMTLQPRVERHIRPQNYFQQIEGFHFLVIKTNASNSIIVRTFSFYRIIFDEINFLPFPGIGWLILESTRKIVSHVWTTTTTTTKGAQDCSKSLKTSFANINYRRQLTLLGEKNVPSASFPSNGHCFSSRNAVFLLVVKLHNIF